jgi:hypothetical protein
VASGQWSVGAVVSRGSGQGSGIRDQGSGGRGQGAVPIIVILREPQATEESLYWVAQPFQAVLKISHRLESLYHQMLRGAQHDKK